MNVKFFDWFLTKRKFSPFVLILSLKSETFWRFIKGWGLRNQNKDEKKNIKCKPQVSETLIKKFSKGAFTSERQYGLRWWWTFYIMIWPEHKGSPIVGPIRGKTQFGVFKIIEINRKFCFFSKGLILWQNYMRTISWN